MKIKRMTAAVIILAMVLIFGGCGATQKDVLTTTDPISVEPVEKHLDYEVVDANGNAETFHMHTTKETVGEALQEAGVLEGVEGEFGIYIKSVNGVVADYDIDGTYWAFYINDEMSMKGADQVPIVEGELYSFRIEKG